MGCCVATLWVSSSAWDAANGVLVPQSKWRACKGFATNLAYITGTDANYVADWAVNPSKSALLNAGKSTVGDLEVACKSLVADGQIGEIYELAQKNEPNCTGCLRMAIYNISEGSLLAGYVSDTGSQKKWTCGKTMPPPPQPECPSETTCGDIKAAYRTNSCCGNPSAQFTMSGNRRLAASTQKDDLLSHISKEMKRAKAENSDVARSLANEIKSMMQDFS
eukprot:TRINITY_DN7119_c0_g1_i1.p1 TRINITY_DN7119_c0_g1~~TRINITY_DN7119_c0_g1_i1.p1  ORF type:complete len:221 (+),score=42.73 TRINITY_DN7119_c0_g1_i1:98-760(+)